MPEGDTVYLSARRMHEALAGRMVLSSDFRLPALAGADVGGRTVLEVVPRGKHMLMRFDDGRTLHTHFRMDGSWRVYAAGRRWNGGPAYEVRVVLTTADRQAVGYRLHDVELMPTADEPRVVGHLGPDLLGPDWDEAEALRRLREQPQREIGPALLDQRNLAGIGNVYKVEVLFLRGLSPWTPVGEVPDLAGLVRLARRLLTANKDRWEQVTTGSTRRGEQHWVYERTGRPCRRCGTPVRGAEQPEPPWPPRLTYWCPHCQPGVSPPLPATRRV
jgi:endonuclease-8